MRKHVQVTYKKYPADAVTYSVEGARKKFSILTSELDKGWRKSGESLLDLLDDGNGINLVLHSQNIRLDYQEVELIRLALGINNDKLQIKELDLKPFGGLDE